MMEAKMKQYKKARVLEQRLEFAPRVGQARMYETIDVYATGTIALYTPPPTPFGLTGLKNITGLRDDKETLGISSKPFGVMDPQPFQFGYDLPGTGIQFHFHGPDRDHLTYGKLVDYKRNILFEEKDSFKLAMDDFRFDKGGFKKFP